jgi:hypothetical protein
MDMRIAVPTAPNAAPIPNASERTSDPQKGAIRTASGGALSPETCRQAPEELWAGHRRNIPVFGWLLSHPLIVLGFVIPVLLGMAALLPALGVTPTSQTQQSEFPGLALGVAVSPGRLAATQPSRPSARRVEHSRNPLSLIAPAALPDGTPRSAGQNMLVSLDLPAGVTATLPPGQTHEGQQSFRSLLLAFALAVFLVYLVTASQLESLLNPLSILFTVPMGLIAAAWGLYATGASLNAVALIGTILLAGILVNNAIVLIDAIKNARARGTRAREAMIQASRARVRPIMITSIGTVLGLLPMAIGVGETIGVRRPMTITVIAGLAVATFLVAVAAPVLYTLFDPRSNKPV